jgi:DNA polymerase III subunit gamma/tau
MPSYGGAVNDEPDSAPAEEPMLGMDLPAAPASAPSPSHGPYRVLARKYRPQKFSELIGQDALVQTLSNAIARDRLAHAFLMTGVRGVGKTSTARLIAKALNCTGPDGQGGPTIDPCGVCDACVAITEGRHIDVIEMDAASHTGVDDVREIIEAVRYAAVSARFKIYIIDEVHMLSKNAFNALLKTLEEPPPHVKFLFATTEVNKVPVTVLSRCQRFDLRRITPDLLFDHFRHICQTEQVAADDDALRLIAAAAEGSVRDGLSILDQAIAHGDMDGDARVTAAQVRDMLGVADGGSARDLFAAIVGGDGPAAITLLRDGYARGLDPLAQVRALMGLAHGVALARVSRTDDPALSAEDRAAIDGWAAQIGMAKIQRLWQMLLRAHAEVASAGDALMSAEMAVLRVIHAGTMPDPDELARRLANVPSVESAPPVSTAVAAPIAAPIAVTEASPPAAAAAPPPVPAPAPVVAAAAPEPIAVPESAVPTSIETLAERLADAGHQGAASLLRREGRLVGITADTLLLARSPAMDETAIGRLTLALRSALGEQWVAALSDEAGEPTLAEQRATATAQDEAQLRAHPLVDAALRQFPDAEYRPPATGTA